MNYSYLSDGTKTRALKANGSGLVYRGPFVYRRGSDGSLTFESASFSGGRLTSSGALLYVTDYLGSVRAVVNGSNGEIYKASDYSTFGSESKVESIQTASFSPVITLRDGYTGKEAQTPDFSTGYTDFGARQYSPTLRRWMTPDPLSEKYYGTSPYAFCNNNPVNFVDPDGTDIVFNGQDSSSVVIFTPDYDYIIDLSGLGVNFGGNYYFEGQEALQIGLDIVGIFDPYGAADIVNGSIYLSNGDYGNAILSGVGLIPYLGDLAKFSRLKKGVESIDALIKLQKHHIIPKAVYKRFTNVSEFLLRDSKANLIDLPAGFHGNHPAYSTWVTNRLNDIAKTGLSYDKLMKFKREAISEIENAYQLWIDSGKSSSANMNEYFKRLNAQN